MSHANNQPFHPSDLDNPGYRDRLLRKLNCLIAVLEVARAKVNRSMDEPEADNAGLSRIQTNLGSTLDVCQRAKRALESRGAIHDGLPAGFPVRGAEIRAGGNLPRGAFVEMTSPDEYQRFSMMGRIAPEDIAECDLDALSIQLQE